VFIRRDDKVLLIHRSASARVWPGRFNGVGGHVEAGEALAEAARREVREETGLHVQNLRLAGLLHVTEAGLGEGVLVVVFTAEADRLEVVASTEGGLHWVDLARVHELDLVPDVAPLLSRLWPTEGQAVFLARATPGEGEALTFADGVG